MAGISKRDRNRIIKLLEKDEEIPLDYKHILFPPEKREYELVYAVKEREEDILSDTMAVPLQPIKTFGTNGNGWTDKLIFGDNLQVMKSLLDDPEVKGQVKLIYIDPPFATQQEFKGSKDQQAYQDKISGARFLEFLRKRLVFIRELLSKDGFILVHLDYRYVSYFRVLLDELIGRQNFRNEIIVRRSTKSVQSQFENITALTVSNYTILLYSKNSSTRIQKLTQQFSDSSDGKWDTFWRSPDRPTMRYEIFGQKRDRGQWRWKKDRAYRAKENYERFIEEDYGDDELDDYYISYFEATGVKLDFVRLSEKGSVQYYVPPRTGKMRNNSWMDIPSSSRLTGYPTEKSEQLLNRVVSWLSKKNDIVLDAFAGSGTTLAVAEKLGRRWIGIDCGKLAIYTIQKRLLNLKSEIGNKGKKLKPKPFTLYHAGLYDFSKLKKLPWAEWRKFALLLFNSRDEKHMVLGIELDGYMGRSDVLVFDYQKEGGVVLDYGFVDDLHAMIGSKVGREFFIIAPAASVTFLEDYIDKDSVRYYILRIPYSIINELHNKDFEAIKQPIDESQVNDTVDAVGFDFIRQPKVECSYSIEKPKNQLLEYAVIKIKTFKSEAMLKGASQLENRESLSMIMVDFDYDNKIFDLDKSFYASEIEKNAWKVFLPLENIKKQIMIIYLDIYGNEYREIKTQKDFSDSKRVKRGSK